MAVKKEYLFNPERNPLVRADYRPTEYKIPEVAMYINLDPEKTVVRTRLRVKRNPDLQHLGGPLELDGEDLKLRALRLIEDGKPPRDLDPQEYSVGKEKLVFKRPPQGPFTLEVITEINPSANTRLEGIYMAGDVICSQCEAQGFRRITYFMDRPDNLATFSVALEADKGKFPVLLSNGNGDHRQSFDLGNGRHRIVWEDPFPKPSYLFAVVGGDLKVVADSFTTMSGRDVALRIVVEPGYEDKVAWAMQAVKRAMKWDEEKYGREYDLDVFHVAAVSKFNAGAMENKGLNIFNISALVGDGKTATDGRLTYIEAVVAHEYFHNWTGDRVTLRDWFELTLKEGLTVLRDRQFTEDMHSLPIKRIDDAQDMRAGQFLEDSGPGAHPIRPDAVEEFNNIYSGTVYNKGSHVLGMLKTIVGDDMWRAGMDAYFDRFDGRAATCEDFVRTHELVSGIDLTQFRRWYAQSGTPEISYDGVYDAKEKTYTLTLRQNTSATADQAAAEKLPLHIPVRMGLIAESGRDAVEEILHLTQREQTFVFKDLPGPVVPSLFRGFSAPVKVTTTPPDSELAFRMAHDSDPFNRYEAGERLMIRNIQGLVAGTQVELDRTLLDAYRVLLDNAAAGDMAFTARVLSLPDYSMITQDMALIDPDAVNAALKHARKTLAAEFRDDFARIYEETRAPAGEAYDVVPAQTGRRALHNLSLWFRAREETPAVVQDLTDQYYNASNMTEKLGALSTLSALRTQEAQKAMDDFYLRHKDNTNLVSTWLSTAAAVPHGDARARVEGLMTHEAYDRTNPNRVRALVGGYLGNPARFHKKDGSGYAFVADRVIEMNAVNPHTAAGLAHWLTDFRQYDAQRRELMLAQMRRVMAVPDMDRGVKEILGKALDAAATTEKKVPERKFQP